MRPSPAVRRRAGAVALAAAAVALVWLLLSGGGDPDVPEDPFPPPQTTTRAVDDDAPEPELDAATEHLVESVMLVGFEGTDAQAIVEDLDRNPYGALLIGTSNWAGKGEGAKLIEAIRKAGGSRAPLIVTDQEGGVYRSLPDLPPPEREIEIGDRGKPELAEEWGESGAKALADAGIDLNLAPVADVATLDSAIADRAFSDDPAVAADMTAAAVEGCEKGGVACAVAHFPGLGAAAQSTDAGPASIGLDVTTLRARDVLPFEAAFAAGAPATVVSHGLYVAYDPVTPASLSRAITTDLLRDELGFEGVAISDDIGAGAIGAVSDPGSAAVDAVNAGIDLVQVADPRDVVPVRQALEAAVESGELSVERLQEAADRVAELRDSGQGTEEAREGEGNRPKGPKKGSR